MAGKEQQVVKGLDLKRYTGRWYEISSIPKFFTPKDAKDTRATYTLNGDGTVHVLNETFSDGKRSSIEGTAYKADPKSDEAKLKVKFIISPLVPIPVVGDYWVLYVDADYQVAIVGNANRTSLWILSRKSHLDEKIYNDLVEKAKEQGYDVSKLHKTPQSDTPPEGGPVDPKGVRWFKSFLG
ncbi:hypothetical protein Lal_00040567 [Lupinus albus]|uniref:Putative zeaxanthin epoxidase n=1 Tax=Lupinus albus TaxID=3870 RepID=A0A6A4PJN4_LUPAL|nr:putative zeaxanthin epoxidase [Lupinus albus]KAE9601745.1 putative zeaxanthin epoxidase [Lupinus albus]KAF1855200.1 hypothetical protein Lal_00012462 [Lupinus albus]KAF1856038.1 hypothetical protein Lal_00041049 [Lupinus albus]KAF1887246.1 hypothetical protein Lal_00040846 [Lupinus albus]